MSSTSGVVASPQVDDLVLLLFPVRNDEPIVIGNLYGDQDENRAPKGAADVIRLTRGELFIELLGDGSEARIAKKDTDTGTPTAEVSIDDSGGIDISTDGDISISADGTVNITGTSDVTIDEGGQSQSVLTENAVFEFQQRVDTGDGSGGTVTQTTTTVSNGATTETDIE
jgi:hypothetical protein